MSSFFSLVLLCACISMFFVDGYKKMAILILSTICMCEFSLPTSIGGYSSILPICYLTSELRNLPCLLRRLRDAKILYIFIIVIAYLIITNLSSG